MTSVGVNEPAAGGSWLLPSGDLAVPQLLSIAVAERPWKWQLYPPGRTHTAGQHTPSPS